MTMTCNDKNDEMSRNLRENTKINPNANDNMYEEEREENLLKHDDNNDDNNGFPYAPPPPLPPLSESVARLSPSSRVDGSVEIHQPEPAPLMLLFDNNEPTQIVHCECTAVRFANRLQMSTLRGAVPQRLRMFPTHVDHTRQSFLSK
ncbi:conserved hypothetical protein [Trichinella spiralis]|uniref:hypothetical protein n=1 Tax=Trichinella spiralis TaxID=6334 RepID=UPI0001EFB281|nr:conserved hypothetical protein [Trichinella spiralis]